MQNVNPKKHHSTTNQIAQYIYDNVEENLSLDLLAKQFSVSKYHLNRLFLHKLECTLGSL
jgi:YesN/AraC family two-component response regulator